MKKALQKGNALRALWLPLFFFLSLQGFLQAQKVYEIYNSNGGTWTFDYIILSEFSPNQSVSGLSLQYRGNTSSAWQGIGLTGNADANGFYRVWSAPDASGAPWTPQLVWTTGPNMPNGGTAGTCFQVALMNTTNTIAGTGTCPAFNILDVVAVRGTNSGAANAVSGCCGAGNSESPSNNTQSHRRASDTGDDETDFVFIDNPYTTPTCSAGTISGTTTICAGTTTQLASNGDAGGTWHSTNTAAATVNASGLVSGLAAGTTTITYIVTNGACHSSASTVVTVNATPNAGTISGTTSVCAGSTTQLSSNGVGGGIWSSTNTAAATVNASGLVSGVAGGTATIRYTVTAGSCTNTATALVTVNAAPNAGTISGTATICLGATTQLASNGDAGGTWSSNFMTVATVNSSGLVSSVTGGTATITYTVTSAACNTSTSTSTVVTVNARPNAAIALVENNVSFSTLSGLAYYNVSYTDGILCTGPALPNPSTSATLTASGGGTYLWSNGSTNNAITVNMANTYTVLVTNAAGCQSTASQTISVNAAPSTGTISATPANGYGVCYGSTITLSSTVSGGEWYVKPRDPSYISVDPVTGLVTPLLSTVSVDSQSVFYKVTLNGCNNVALTTITVLDAPNAGTISGNTSICSSPFFGNNTTQLSIIGGAGGGTWASSNTNVATVNGSGLVSSVPPSTNSGTSIISYTVTNGSCSNTATILITVNANPSALVTSTPQNTCVNTDVTISVPDAGVGANYTWSGDITNTNSNTIVSNTSIPGIKIYNVSVTAANGCSNTGFGFHLVNEPINTTITATPNPVCFGVTLSLSIPQAASTTASWAGPGINNTNGFSTTASPTSTGLQTYTVTATANDYFGNCVYTGTVDVMVETTQPTCNVSGPTLVCPGSTATFNAPNGLSDYSWGVTGDGSIVGASNGASVSVTAGTSGTYTVMLTVTSASGCTNTCSQLVTLNTVPSCPITYAPPNGQLGVPVAASSLSWGSVPNVTHYLVYFGSNAPNYNNIFNGYDNGASTNRPYPALAPNTTYGYRIVPVNDCGQAIGCPTITFSTCTPTFTCPANRNVDLNANCAIAIPDLVTGLAADPGCGVLNFTQNPTASTLLTAVHNATVSVTILPDDPAVASCQVTLTPKDVTPPTVSCPGLQTLPIGNSVLCTAVLGSVPATFGDNCGATLAYQMSGATTTGGSGQISGLTVNSGVTNITYTATDQAGLTSTCSFAVSVAPCINGKVIWEINRSSGVKDVTITVTGDQSTTALTPLNGEYSIALSGGSNFTITPSKALNKLNGVNALDVTRIQQHLGASPITNLYQLIAADVNSNNTISALDANIIQLGLLGNPSALAQMVKSWRFVPVSHTLSNPPWGFPEQIVLTGSNGNQSNLNFYGMKVGDVASTYANPANAGQGSPFVLRTLDQRLEAGKAIAVEFRADPLSDLVALQFALRFDPQALQLVKTESLGGLPLTADNFGAYDAENGSLRLVWATDKGLALKQTTDVIRLTFKVMETGGRLSDLLQLDDETLAGHIYNSLSMESDVLLRFDASTAVGNPQAEAQVQLFQNRPNPFVSNTSIGFVLPEACEARLRILDAAGRVVAERNKQYPAGRHEETFGLSATPGILYYELTTPSGVLTKKMVKAE